MSQKNFMSYGDAETLMTELASAIGDKVDKVNGKDLSTNDYSNTDKAIVDGVASALAGKVDTSSVGSANGVAELDANGKVPSSQLPSYVDDVLGYADLAHFPATGETGKIYIAEDTGKTYRWSGSDYAEISESLALGETSSTAYPGNKVKANADAIAGIKNGTSINSFGDVETALAGKANTSAIPTKTSQLTNDSGFITNSVNNLSNDYTKSNTYTKSEVDNKLNNIGGYTRATGRYTTASWATGTNTCVWTAPSAGTYIVWMRLMLDESQTEHDRDYKAFEMRGTCTRVLADQLLYDQWDGATMGDTISQPVVATQAGQTIIPYVHTENAGLMFDAIIVGLRVK